jgi:hypothetical protein
MANWKIRQCRKALGFPGFAHPWGKVIPEASAYRLDADGHPGPLVKSFRMVILPR